MPSWCLIESDPAVFTELIQLFGVRDVAVEEIVGLEPVLLRGHANVYGLILLFKWNKAQTASNTHGVVVLDAPIYFAQQTVNNACATLAIVNTLFNHSETIDLGENLTNLLSFTQDMTPNLRGTLVGENETLRSAHNSFAPVELFSLDSEVPDAGDVYHFVTFVYKNGAIWELDGLQDGPILAGDASDENYKDKLMDVVQGRIREMSAADESEVGKGISFSLMAVVDDRLRFLEKEIEEARKNEVSTAHLEEQLAALRAEREKGRVENMRRRHNYAPMIVELLKALAEKGKLKGILDDVLSKRNESARRS
ncbi:putative Ubiquitin carboxyl terminal hydrolase family 1 [Trypanosoma vivax]|uniref:Ubiquitin carboxyl-terminal hydrolase n=1 Tax=Trypanosoma vivax (strain Y486) TaxID=1055687 RepID=G0UB60_TRYVY|nr:putative ubiquitin carboxyl-terminal hydrolase [Trypanosoma vivax]KAH8606310.1 putative Ubiquitin carboxyl terminal hydrolase family 1 [Trypanosoma vivax]CCC53047.1 putative ubiquitin carboxyl-terminal hydrolase [Trypanosoma vivax Y486]